MDNDCIADDCWGTNILISVLILSCFFTASSDRIEPVSGRDENVQIIHYEFDFRMGIEDVERPTIGSISIECLEQAATSGDNEPVIDDWSLGHTQGRTRPQFVASCSVHCNNAGSGVRA